MIGIWISLYLISYVAAFFVTKYSFDKCTHAKWTKTDMAMCSIISLFGPITILASLLVMVSLKE